MPKYTVTRDWYWAQRLDSFVVKLLHVSSLTILFQSMEHIVPGLEDGTREGAETGWKKTERKRMRTYLGPNIKVREEVSMHLMHINEQNGVGPVDNRSSTD